jgi:hypothetical protein
MHLRPACFPDHGRCVVAGRFLNLHDTGEHDLCCPGSPPDRSAQHGDPRWARRWWSLNMCQGTLDMASHKKDARPQRGQRTGPGTPPGRGTPQRLLRLLGRNASAPRRLLTRRRLVRHFANSAGTRPKFTRCKAIGYIGGRNDWCRIGGVVGSSYPDTSTPHVGARLAALGRADSYLRNKGASHAATQNQT